MHLFTRRLSLERWDVFDVLDLIVLRWVCGTEETCTHHRRCRLSVVDFSGVVVVDRGRWVVAKKFFSCVGSGGDVDVGVRRCRL